MEGEGVMGNGRVTGLKEVSEGGEGRIEEYWHTFHEQAFVKVLSSSLSPPLPCVWRLGLLAPSVFTISIFLKLDIKILK